jgi:S1-C subfamily serine protease
MSLKAKLFSGVLALALVASACGVGTVTAPGEERTPAPEVTLDRVEAPPEHSDLAGVVEQVLPGVVNVKVDSEGCPGLGLGPAQGEGSGVIIDEEGIVLTNAHVVQQAPTVELLFSDGRDPVEGEVVGTVTERDLAVVQVQVDDLTAVPLGRSSELKLGDQVVALGFPLGLGGPTVTAGIISGEERTIRPQDGPQLEGMLQTDAAINPGNSGGPLIDMAGRVIGINTATARGIAENVGFAIAIDSAIPVVEQIVEGNLTWLGVVVQPVDSDVAAFELGLPRGTRGVVIREIAEGSPAQTAGLRVGEVITEVGDTDIEGATDLPESLGAHEPGDEVEIRLMSPEGERSVEVEVGRRPSPGELC